MSILEINNLTILNNKDVKIINDLSISLEKNTFNTVIGKTNSGKTVLVNSIFNLSNKGLRVTSGDIIYDAQSIFKIKNYDDYRGNEVAVLFNNPRVIFNSNYKIEKQITEMLILKKIYSNKKEIKKEINYYLELLDIDRKYLSKYQDNVDNKNIKKIAIMLLLLFKPKILIIDDSFHSLDSITVKLIYLLLKKIKNKFTILFFTSINSSIVSLSNKVHYLYKGKILESLNYKKINDYKLIHPYRMLFNNMVSMNSTDDSLTDLSKGCIYYNMCFKKRNTCLEFDNTLKELEEGHILSCMYLLED